MMRSTLVLLAASHALTTASCSRSESRPPPGATDAAATISPSAATSENTKASSSTTPWPRVVPLVDPSAQAAVTGSSAVDPLAVEDPAGAASDSPEIVDASVSITDASRSPADGAIDARPDARSPYDDAGLFGTKTYPDENPMRGIRRVTAQAAKVHKAIKDGTAITSLPKGTEVSLVAELWDWYRVRYTDPNTGMRRQGWVYFTNFAGPRQKSCPEGWTWHAQDGGFCDRECNRNTDCRALKGYKCSGTMCFYAAD